MDCGHRTIGRCLPSGQQLQFWNDGAGTKLSQMYNAGEHEEIHLEWK